MLSLIIILGFLFLYVNYKQNYFIMSKSKTMFPSMFNFWSRLKGMMNGLFSKNNIYNNSLPQPFPQSQSYNNIFAAGIQSPITSTLSSSPFSTPLSFYHNNNTTSSKKQFALTPSTANSSPSTPSPSTPLFPSCIIPSHLFSSPFGRLQQYHPTANLSDLALLRKQYATPLSPMIFNAANLLNVPKYTKDQSTQTTTSDFIPLSIFNMPYNNVPYKKV